MWVRALGWEDPPPTPKVGMAIHSNNLAWRIPWTEEPGSATVHGVAKSQIGLKRLSTHACSHAFLNCVNLFNNLTFLNGK